MKKSYKLAVAAAAVAIGFTKVSAATPAQASVINYNLTVDVTSGANVGEYHGSFSYDDSTLRREGSEKVGISQGLSILFNYLGTTYTENNDTGSQVGFPIVSFDNGKLLGLNYLVHNQFYIADHLGSPYTGGSKFYQYPNSSDDGQSGTQVGTVMYSGSTSVPEPSTIVGAVAAAGIGLLMKRW
ncbi:MAG: PEP-CTERM sorting domain-containing protein [Stigonema ocellatum SAG 48.90 = DSM 106950]|nr:PEP-CTERM sorting domain-containing protein [Stigonema ocellatum SAG 48.90 = DSM 106950]